MSYVFIVGLERCGTHSLVSALKNSCLVSAYIKHEVVPCLCKEVHDLLATGDSSWQHSLEQRVADYKWIARNSHLVCEGNHRLGFFIKYLSDHLYNSKFILLVRDPVSTIVSCIATLAHWPDIIDQYPDCFKEKISTLIPPEKEVFNKYRPKPPDLSKPLHELYLWEWIETYRFTKNQLDSLNNRSSFLVVETEGLNVSIGQIVNFIDSEYFDIRQAKKEVGFKLDSVYTDPLKADLLEFAIEVVAPHEDYIRDVIIQEFPDDTLVRRITGESNGLIMYS